MTMHTYRPRANMEILVEMGYDRPLDRLFLTIYLYPETAREVILYDCLDDRNRSTFTDRLLPKTKLLDYYCDRISEVALGQWDVPNDMKLNILDDAFSKRGNRITKYEDD